MDISHIKAVIFDMDGTLVESEHIWSEAKQSIARDAGINIAEDGLNKYIGRGLNDFIDEVLTSMHESHCAEMNRKIQKRVLVDYGSNISVIDGAIEILNAFSLAGVRLAICSSGPLQAIESSLRALRATESIEVIVSGDTLTCGKPNPLPYLLTLKRLCLDAKHTIVFEDTGAGLVSATTAGISTVVVGQDAEKSNFSKVLCVDPLLKNFRISLDSNNEDRS